MTKWFLISKMSFYPYNSYKLLLKSKESAIKLSLLVLSSWTYDSATCFLWGVSWLHSLSLLFQDWCVLCLVGHIILRVCPVIDRWIYGARVVGGQLDYSFRQTRKVELEFSSLVTIFFFFLCNTSFWNIMIVNLTLWGYAY